jgi:arylsulfatase A-like enzyme
MSDRADRPNVVLICCDDLGYGDLGCYGAAYETPNVDALADDGIRLTDCHSNAPVCSPSRASLLTGRYPQRAGVPSNAPQGRPETNPETGLPPSERTLAAYLGDAGYRTGAFGKWHLGMTEEDGPNAHGFDEFFGFRSGCVDFYSHIMMWLQGNGVPPYHDLWENGEEVWRNGEYLTDLITERATEFLTEAAAEERPFFTYVAYNAPHYPLHAPEDYRERVRHLGLDPERQAIAAMLQGVDDGVGAIVEVLEEAGVRENTVLLFTSDHGPSREIRNHLDGSRDPFEGGKTGGYRGEKFSLFEGGIRVPGIASYPGAIPRGETSDELVVGMDAVPTILDFCGVEPAATESFDGESLRGVLTEGESTPHDRVYWSSGEQLAVRDGDWKLTLDARENAGDPDEAVLADLDADPGESTNLVDEHPERADRLETAVRDWRATVADD